MFKENFTKQSKAGKKKFVKKVKRYSPAE
ncbi:hypothetical protein Gotur_035505 [Gossypium turneri]